MREGITFAGSMIVDHINRIDAYPMEGQLVPIRSISGAVGGLVCNTGVDLAVLDPTVPVFAIGNVGSDSDGRMILSKLQEHGIDISGIREEGVTSHTEVFSTTDQRTFFQFGGACDTFCPNEKAVASFPGRLLHIGYLLLLPQLDAPDAEYGTKMARTLCAAKKAGFETSIDVVSENTERYAEIVPPALPYVDYLCLNETEAGKTVGLELREDGILLRDRVREALIRLRKSGAMKWVIIHYPEGAYGMDANGNEFFSPSVPLPCGYIKGKVGAGDAFCAGVLLAAYQKKSLQTALLYGNAAAQVSLRDASATGSMTTIEQALAEYHRYAKS